jgi:CIC family chloride channel protein
MISHIITSGITIGFGGSSGLEAPIATTGAAIGSNYARTYHMNYKQRTLLLGCGAAAGIAAAFNAPIAGVLFSIEVLLVDISASAFIPLIIAAAMGALCSNMVLGEDILLSFTTQQLFNSSNVPYYLLLALLAGIFSIYHTRIFLGIDSLFDRVRNQFGKALLGGLVLILLISFFPPLSGEGFNSILVLSQLHPEKLISNSIFSEYAQNEVIVILFLGAILFTKSIATAATLSGGGNGGNFAPSLMTGAFLGAFFSRAVNLTGFAILPEGNFILVAMAGVMSGVMHAPLTAIFLIAEVTGGYGLMIPLMIVSTMSFSLVKFLDPESIDSRKLAKKGETIIHDRDKKILASIPIKHIIETDFLAIDHHATLGELVELIRQSKRNIFPVVTEENKLTGIILLDSIREIMFNQTLYSSVLVKDISQKAPVTIDISDSLESIMEKFDATGSWNLPVLKEGKYAGFISKSAIFNKYRSQLIDRSVS